ncbi:MAG: hypothetical protein J6Y82_08560 [Bacteroidales bacterium]|nr:hypothetical protein [Bacteroidales bacterium]
MKKLLLIVFAACLVLGCDKTPLTLEKKAEQQFAEYVKQHPNTTSSDSRIVYKTDSICILHFVLSDNKKSDSIEYIYYVENDSIAYDTYFSLSDKESVYADEETMNNIIQGTFCSGLDYRSAIKQRIITQLNETGKVIGKTNLSVKLNPLIKTGDWVLKLKENEFHEKTEETYLTLVGTGNFSNSATTGRDLSVILFVTKKSISLRLVEYNNHVVKDKEFYSFNIKDSQEKITTFSLLNDESGYLWFSDYDGDKKNMTEILEKEGIIHCSGRREYSSLYSNYVFTFNLDGYNEAVKYLK